MQSNNQLLSYVFFAAGVVVVALNIAGIIADNMMLVLLSFFGFSGVAALRQFIEAQGWKTYFAAAMGIVGVIASVLLPSVVSPDVLQEWLLFWGLIAGIGFTHAIGKNQYGK
jgi:hypothetical protein